MERIDCKHKREVAMGRKNLRKTDLGDIGASLGLMAGWRDGAGGVQKRKSKMGVEYGKLGVGG